MFGLAKYTTKNITLFSYLYQFSVLAQQLLTLSFSLGQSGSKRRCLFLLLSQSLI